jgi:hypothetical protein
MPSRKIRMHTLRESIPHLSLVTKLSDHLSRLQQRKEREWGDKVKLLFGDMRSLDVPEPVDVLISELLGSFGDNELSPECIDGAQRFLKRTSSLPTCNTHVLTRQQPQEYQFPHPTQPISPPFPLQNYTMKHAHRRMLLNHLKRLTWLCSKLSIFLVRINRR